MWRARQTGRAQETALGLWARRFHLNSEGKATVSAPKHSQNGLLQRPHITTFRHTWSTRRKNEPCNYTLRIKSRPPRSFFHPHTAIALSTKERKEKTKFLNRQSLLSKASWVAESSFSFLSAWNTVEGGTSLTPFCMSEKVPLNRWVWAFQMDLARTYFLLKTFHSFTQCVNCSAEIENRKNHLACHQVLKGVSVSVPWPGRTTEKMDAWHATRCPQDTTWHPYRGGWVSRQEPKNSKIGRL